MSRKSIHYIGGVALILCLIASLDIRSYSDDATISNGLWRSVIMIFLCEILVLTFKRKAVSSPFSTMSLGALLIFSCAASDIVNHCFTAKTTLWWGAMACFWMFVQTFTLRMWCIVVSILTFSASVCIALKYGNVIDLCLFNNPAGEAAAICMGFPAVTQLLRTNKTTQTSVGLPFRISQYAIFATLTISFSALCFTHSRTDIVAYIVGIIVYWTFLRGHHISKVKALMLSIGILTFLCILTTGLYFCNRDSADGRILIYKTDLALCAKAPLLGNGTNAIPAHYMECQAEVLQRDNDPHEDWLAGDVTYAFNEILGFCAKYGFIGFSIAVLFIFSLARQISIRLRPTFYSALSIFLVLGMCSYPTAYPYVSLLCIGYIGAASHVNDKKSLIGEAPLFLRGLGILFLSFFCISSYKQWHAELLWRKLSLRPFSEVVLSQYEHLKGELESNPWFIYNYAALLNESGSFENSYRLVQQLDGKLRTYDTELLQGDNALSLHQEEEALIHFRKAHSMVPVRFMPLYGMMRTYQTMDDDANALKVARYIGTKDIKVPSKDVYDIKCEAQKLLNP